ncbi:hypothetical protein ABZ896_42110 [Streptomyces sp. NPDC047072]|uniref:hypothetical protein n=1 Tax=Streptomyces sp. NPDC047072 TaxID=3154809 RepID=UPI0033C4AE29
MWEGLDAVEWAGLEHNYGAGEDVPGLLRRCAGPDPGDAEEAADDLLNLLFHQGGWICPAAVAALPFLLRLAARPEVPCRRPVLDLVAMLAAEAGRVRKRHVAPGWAAAWEHALPEVLTLLGDPAAEVRRAAANIVSDCTSPGADLLPALLDAWHTETDPAARLDLVLALGAAATRAPVGPRDPEPLPRSLLDAPDPQLRLAAVHALAPRDPGLPERRLDLVLDAVRAPGVELWQDTAAVEGGAQAVQYFTGELFADSPAAYTSYVRGLLADHPDEVQRIGALAQAARVLSGWHSPVPALLPALVARLDDPSPTVRFQAVELLACLGPAATAHADRIVPLVDDTGVSSGRSVGDVALWALARMNDPRCVPGLAERLAGAVPSTFPPYGVHTSGQHHFATLPALYEVLVLLPDHADRLLPAVLARLAATGDARERARWCEVLAAWGDGARTAVPQLVELLTDEECWTGAATALGAIGGADGRGRERLLERAEGSGAGAGSAGSRSGGSRNAAESQSAGSLGAAGPRSVDPLGAAETQSAGSPSAAETQSVGSVETTAAPPRRRPDTRTADSALAAWAQWRTGGAPEPALTALARAVEGDFPHPQLARLADLGSLAAPLADRLRALTGAEYDWTRVEAAYALWSATGETEVAVPVLLAEVRGLAEGQFLPVAHRAVRHLTRIGPPAARPAADLLRRVPDRDARLSRGGGWRGFEADERIRAAIAQLLAHTG